MEVGAVPGAGDNTPESKTASLHNGTPLSAHSQQTFSSSSPNSLPSPSSTWRHEQSLAPLSMTTNFGTDMCWVPPYGDVPPDVHELLQWAISKTGPPTFVQDKASYLAGEKSALFRMFQEVLPSQQALGALASAVQRLKERVGEIADARNTLQSLQASFQAQKDRMDALEGQRLPAIESMLHCLQRDSSPKELTSVLAALHGLHASALAAQRREAEWRRKTSAERVLATFAGWVRGSISQLDVAMLFLSRRILLGKQADNWDAPPENSAASARRHRAAIGAAVFVGVVEAAWQAHKAGERYWLPSRLLTPMRPGLKVLRGACWASLLVLSANELRQRCLMLASYGPGETAEPAADAADAQTALV